jgi:plastocyanin
MSDPALTAATVAEGLDQPTGMAFLGPDDILITEKATGHVRRVRGSELSEEPVLDLAVNYFDERGLLGIAVDPGFPDEPFVYLYWTARNDSDDEASLSGPDTEEATDLPDLGNRVDRFRWDGSALAFDGNIVRLRSNTLQTDTLDRIRGNHDAGPLVFGPDGMLYIVNGDQNLRGQLQNIQDGPAPNDANFTGVVLRMDPDGSIPEDNPFAQAGADQGGEAGENISMIYAYGIRNTFGMTFHPETGDLWATENGDDTWDELNILTPGANSGWIQVMGPPERFDQYKSLEVATEDGLDNPDFPPDQLAGSVEQAMERMFQLPGSEYVAPELAWLNPPAVTAIAFSDDAALGGEGGSAWVGTVLTDSLLRYPMTADGSGLELSGGLEDGVDDNTAKGDLGESADHVAGTGFGIVTDIRQGPDGRLWVLSLSAGSVYAISAGEPNGSPAPSPSGSAPASPSGSPAASQSPGSGSAEVTIGTDEGQELLFVPETAEAPTGAQVTLTFQNVSLAPHNLTFSDPIEAATQTIVNPGASETLEFAAPEPGDYTFVCTLHPGMDGVLTVTE